MRWLGNFVCEEQVVRKFAFLPIKMVMVGICICTSNLAWKFMVQ